MSKHLSDTYRFKKLDEPIWKIQIHNGEGFYWEREGMKLKEAEDLFDQVANEDETVSLDLTAWDGEQYSREGARSLIT